jgi:MoxR-like ATPase
MHKHLNFVGPKGAGKNKMTFHLSSLFDVDLFDISFSYETSRGDTQGANNFDDDGKIKFQLSGLAQAMQRRCVIVCDEANFARAAMLSDFHSVLDFRRYMEITGYGKITLNEQCIFIITMNEGDGYEGTRPLNEAFRDRFHEVHFKSDPSQMTKVFMQECGVSEADAKELTKLYKLIQNGKVSGMQRVRSGAKYVTDLATLDKERFLAGIYDQLRSQIELISRILICDPRSAVGKSVKFYNASDCHLYFSSFLFKFS